MPPTEYLVATGSEIKKYRVEKNEPYDSWSIVELWPEGTVRSPFTSEAEAVKREEDIAAEYEWKVERVPNLTKQEKSLLTPKRFPKRDEALYKLSKQRGYDIIHVHDDGDLTVRSRGKLYVVTTEGAVFEEKYHTQTIRGGEPVPPQYRYLIGFISEPLPDYSLAVIPEVGERKIDMVMKQLKEGVEGIQDSSQFRLFLTTMSKFHDYSIGNLILIALQKPTATRVAGFNTWRDLGRWVKGGEKGIAILAPVMPPKVKPEKIEGKEEEELEKIAPTPVYFKVVYVFDISQTEGKPLPEFEVPVLTGEANEELFSKLLVLMKAKGIPVSFESQPRLDPAIKGQYSPVTGIWVRPEEPRAQQLKSLAHEIAHYYSEGVFRIPRYDAETIAESAAYVIGAHYGFDSGVRSFPYVALWAKDKKVLEKNLAAIRQVSGTILDGLEKMPAGGGKFLPALKPFEPYHFAEYVLRSNTFSLNEIPVYSGLSGTNPLRVPDHIWQEVLAGIDGEFVKQGELYMVKTPGVERPPYMRAAPTWRSPEGELLVETISDIDFLADVEGNPISKFCCRQCGECAPAELLQEGRFPDRIAWLRSHYKEKHPGMWGKMLPATEEQRTTTMEYIADSPEFLSQTIDNTGLRAELDKTFAEAIARTQALYHK